MNSFSWPIRVYYEDTDSGGVIYHASYLRFMERARTEWLRSYDIEQDALLEHNVIFAVQSLNIDFLAPGKFNEKLFVTVEVLSKGQASLHFRQTIVAEQTEKQLCEAKIKVACLSADRFRPCRIPAIINKEIFGVH